MDVRLLLAAKAKNAAETLSLAIFESRLKRFLFDVAVSHSYWLACSTVHSALWRHRRTLTYLLTYLKWRWYWQWRWYARHDESR